MELADVHHQLAGLEEVAAGEGGAQDVEGLLGARRLRAIERFALRLGEAAVVVVEAP